MTEHGREQGRQRNEGMSLLRPMRSPRGYLVGLIVLLMIVAVVFWLNGSDLPRDSAYVPAIESGGLGLPIAEWESRYGRGRNVVASTAFYALSVDNGAFIDFVRQRSDSQQFVQSIQVHFGSAGFSRLSEDEARSFGMTLLPADATFQTQIRQPVEQGRFNTTDIFTSADLAARYPALCKPEAYPGTAAPGEIHMSQMRDR